MNLSVIIPTWNGLQHLPTCLDALRAQVRSGDRIIVVDNGSRDGTSAWLRTHAPDVHTIRLTVNRGFAGGTNAGIRASATPLVLLCNDDAFVAPGCLAALRNAFHQQPDLGAASGVLVFAHRPDLVASAGIRVSGDGLARDLWALQPVATLPNAPQEIFGASGGLALIRRSMLDDVGLFEESFFSYLEDADLAWRARLRGWGCVVVPDARARHVYSATAGQGSPLKQRLLARNRVRLLVRCLPLPLLVRWLPAMLGYDALAIGYGLTRGQPAIAAGRLEAWIELGALWQQRQMIQRRRRTSVAALARWVERPALPWAITSAARSLDEVLETR